jgi:phasin family protein
MAHPGKPETGSATPPGGQGLPGIAELERLAAVHRQTLDALMEANRVALEAAQAVARRHMEILQAAMGDAAMAMRRLGTFDPAELAGRHAERVAAAQAQALANMRDVAAAIQTTNAAVLGVLGAGAPPPETDTDAAEAREG